MVNGSTPRAAKARAPQSVPVVGYLVALAEACSQTPGTGASKYDRGPAVQGGNSSDTTARFDDRGGSGEASDDAGAPAAASGSATTQGPESHAGRMPAPTTSRARRPGERRRGLNLGPLARLLGFRLRRAQLAVFEDFQFDAPIQLPPSQFGVLVIIDRNPEMTQQQLCDGIGVDKSTFAITLDRLADRGLIRRVRSEEDRRRNSLRITAKGAATLKALTAHAKRHERRVFAALSAEERETLLEVLKRIGEPKVSR